MSLIFRNTSTVPCFCQIFLTKIVLQWSTSECYEVIESVDTQTFLKPSLKSVLLANSCTVNLLKSCSQELHRSLSFMPKTTS